MGRGSSKKKEETGNGGGEEKPETTERSRLKTLAFSNNMLSHTPANPAQPLSPSKSVTKHHGKDILKKSHRKNRFLFSFPGLLAPIAGGKLGELKDLGTKNPLLYLHFPQGRMKLFGTIVYPKNRYLTLQFPRGGKNVMCEDYFDNMIVFSDAWWIGKQEENPEEAQLDFPKELSDGQHTEYDFKGGAGATCINKQCDQKNASIHLEARSPKPNLKDDLSDDENRDFMNVTPVRHSARTAGKTFKFAEASSGDDSVESDSDEYEREDKKAVGHDSSSRKHVSEKDENLCSEIFEIDEKDVGEGTESAISIAKSKKQFKKVTREDSSSNHSSLVQTTISTLFNKVEEKKTPRNPGEVPLQKVSGQKSRHTDTGRKINEDGGPRKRAKVINEEYSSRKSTVKKEENEVEEKDCLTYNTSSFKFEQVIHQKKKKKKNQSH
ncbi:DNA-binding protein RHL1 isoform X1 [Ziziphus jujuba]|uniref:DNA-binding protein RHL1 isoform X1 n=1 Tax=Ziziphus jujuba TaxID=326968 RepID=A0ABM4A0W9_ZIZJJ|nr:DNA-binding protein RHL1 isoform X1 [Ziziphus jujuba var. spinosa]XP_060670374.1 DNA-binding protein RHL1 isoform X1 [Ziziphus jujuba]